MKYSVDLNVRIGRAAQHKIVQMIQASSESNAVKEAERELEKLGYSVISVHEIKNITGQTYSQKSKRNPIPVKGYIAWNYWDHKILARTTSWKEADAVVKEAIAANRGKISETEFGIEAVENINAKS